MLAPRDQSNRACPSKMNKRGICAGLGADAPLARSSLSLVAVHVQSIRPDCKVSKFENIVSKDRRSDL